MHMGGSASNLRRCGLEPDGSGASKGMEILYDSAMVTDNIRWVMVGGTPAVLPSFEI
jgi:hypothetical protein